MTAPLLRLPPVDPLRSPFTGWTRAHWETLADHLLDAVVPYASPGFAQFRLPGRQSRSGLVSDGLEGYARTFLLAAFRIAGSTAGSPSAAGSPSTISTAGSTGTSTAAPTDTAGSQANAAGSQAGSGGSRAGTVGGDGVPAALIERYAQGLAAGTDPTNRYAWPALTDCAQQLVEAASVALALHETRPWLFDRLDAPVRERVVDWLAGFVGKRTWPSNWILFQVVVEQFLANVGGPHDPDEISGGLARIEEWYLGDGWYSDGAGQNFDYYVGWAMHLYTLLWARMAGSTVDSQSLTSGGNPGNAGSPAGAGHLMDRYRDRLRIFLDQYQHFFAGNGAPVHQGRSLTYRFATVAPLWLGALCDATTVPPGTIRRLASGVLRHFVERGVPDERGLLTLGWYEPFLPCTQNYSGPGSPYWASKAFLGLLLPPEHPVWTDTEQPAPIDTGDQVVSLPRPGWLLHATRHDGVVRLVNHGSDRAGRHEDPHYAKLGYATHAAPETGEEAFARGVDGHFAVLAPDGTPSRRVHIRRIAVRDRLAASWYEDELPGGPVRVSTTSLVHGAWEFRVHRVEIPVHRVETPARSAPRPVGPGAPAGPATAGQDPPGAASGAGGYAVREGGYAVAADTPPVQHLGAGHALVRRPDGITSAVIGLHGFDSAEAGVARAVHANALGACSATPYLMVPARPDPPACYVSLVVLSGDPVYPEALRRSIKVAVTGDRVILTLPDGNELNVGPSSGTGPGGAADPR